MTGNQEFTTVKTEVAGIQVPLVATSAELRQFVHRVYVASNENCSHAAEALSVAETISPATVWKLEEGQQKDSQVIRDSLGIRRSPKRPRVSVPTNNAEGAIAILLKHYDEQEIARAMFEVTGEYSLVAWYGTGETGGFEGLEEAFEKLEGLVGQSKNHPSG